MNELLPCPFCGKTAHLGHRDGGKYDKYFLVMCDFCYARTVGETDAEAIAAWNNRANP